MMWIVEATKNVFIHHFVCSIEWGMCHNFLNNTLPPHPLLAWFESSNLSHMNLVCADSEFCFFPDFMKLQIVWNATFDTAPNKLWHPSRIHRPCIDPRSLEYRASKKVCRFASNGSIAEASARRSYCPATWQKPQQTLLACSVFNLECLLPCGET